MKIVKATLHERKLIMSVDRLDYSKGLVERFRAFERLLDAPGRSSATTCRSCRSRRRRAPTWTRTSDIRLQLEGESGRINGRFARTRLDADSLHPPPVRAPGAAALFRAAHVGYVTPLRDGMNLVAKEYVSAQDPDDPGVLVLSQFAGRGATSWTER